MADKSSDEHVRSWSTNGSVSPTTTLYRLFDADDNLLYVGITAYHLIRMMEHNQSKPWWHEVVKVTTEHFAERADAIYAERVAILRELPRYNILGSTIRVPKHNKVNGKYGEGGVYPRQDGRFNVRYSVRGKITSWTARTEEDGQLLLAVAKYRGASPGARRTAIEVLEAGPEWTPGRKRPA